MTEPSTSATTTDPANTPQGQAAAPEQNSGIFTGLFSLLGGEQGDDDKKKEELETPAVPPAGDSIRQTFTDQPLSPQPPLQPSQQQQTSTDQSLPQQPEQNLPGAGVPTQDQEQGQGQGVLPPPLMATLPLPQPQPSQPQPSQPQPSQPQPFPSTAEQPGAPSQGQGALQPPPLMATQPQPSQPFPSTAEQPGAPSQGQGALQPPPPTQLKTPLAPQPQLPTGGQIYQGQGAFPSSTPEPQSTEPAGTPLQQETPVASSMFGFAETPMFPQPEPEQPQSFAPSLPSTYPSTSLPQSLPPSPYPSYSPPPTYPSSSPMVAQPPLESLPSLPLTAEPSPYPSFKLDENDEEPLQDDGDFFEEIPTNVIPPVPMESVLSGAFDKISNGEIFEGEPPITYEGVHDSIMDMLPWWGWAIIFFLLGAAFVSILYMLFAPEEPRPSPTPTPPPTPTPAPPKPAPAPPIDPTRRIYCLIGEDNGRKVVIRVSDPSLCRKTIELSDEEYENSL